ncbi:LOW QUALITY PROTEIN: Putative murein precusor biosynthesis bifunctional protein UDP-N-acetylmuramoylalanyl-D-glutamate--2,6-diaminopimelate ligase MurF [Methyloversatilis universalis FAM5]|uniref:UDP-N-acetylmuramoyl-L-alanyl-D-glutamate--2,6-diaminopimelate ligase n=1 Tax=Methyloversatilis universalis (strain ATCC BAA-1314 / DSM 25237 / JCM 13912 / CCUG 52030 / FAM5) TaxID=1000565 RepID=F5R766_METUF|nr:UDP-N-acetylmuramoyl-L-alanyl-D-glutamate--2,6-diaminopimelate ligase [Methyloversatilis universalis]EGK73517.1 LOW QUALITY PROTEIN: Putative murein precusor biosynthesis bifunctional protein UDP-N-acetylmuramoylalanyl-D-glutamate--2,6-diaminopimelate ligase MurF [Methyloversatilis universalis FAM5]
MSAADAGQTVARVREALARHGITPRAVRADSRRVQPGDLFFALPGQRTDGRRFIDAAIAAGACAVLCEAGGAPAGTTVPVIEIDDLRAHAGALADALLDHPSAALHVIGITGTNGKTSVSQWVAQAMQALGTRCGVIGTLGCGLPGQLAESANTTPDVVSVHQTLADLRAAGATACAMEVSSIGLDQRRIDGVRIHTAAFTNLTRDHLDYHPDMQHYGAAKAALFSHPGLQAAVINTDDAFGRLLATATAARLPVTGCALDADLPSGVTGLRARNVDPAHGLHFDIEQGDARAVVDAALVGRFNVQNLLAVTGCLLHAGVSLSDAARVAGGLVPPPGRMQRLGGRGEPLVVVDYAHTPDALEQALRALQPVAAARGGRLLCVFGCGGDRDPGKRPLMGAVAYEHAARTWITSDNPRGEDPDAILDDIAAGLPTCADVQRERDRAVAIRAAVTGADPRDVVLIAGKGHEPYQEVAGARTPWSDADQAAAALAARGGVQ